jgi:hypothetical protein
MKIITVGDLHGSFVWKRIQPDSWDLIIFMGDYVDSFDYSDDHILKNLLEVIAFRENYDGKVVLLLGNHDLVYYFGGARIHLCSGFRQKMLRQLQSVFNTKKHLFQAAFQIGNYLWSHAGVVKRWHKNHIISQILPEDENLAFTLNRLFSDYYLPLFHVSSYRGGNNKDGGIFWADISETTVDPLPGYHQIIGHTRVPRCIHLPITRLEGTSVTYVDTLESGIDYYKLILP